MLTIHAYMCRVNVIPPLPGICATIMLFVVALKLTSYYQHNAEVLEMVHRINNIKTN
jgi:hypothetical protein